MVDELENSRGVIAVITVDDVEQYLWETQIQKLNELLKIIDDRRKADGKKESRLLI